jgi:hypothetical protein
VLGSTRQIRKESPGIEEPCLIWMVLEADDVEPCVVGELGGGQQRATVACVGRRELIKKQLVDPRGFEPLTF